MLILMGNHGRLCNRLFTFSNVIAFAAEHDLEVWNPGFREYSESFPAISRDAMCRFPPRGSASTGLSAAPGLAGALRLGTRLNGKLSLFPFVRLREPDKFCLDENPDKDFVERIKRGSLVFLDGLYFLAKADFVKHSETIRELFAPSAAIEKSAVASVARARESAEVVIGVHIRQGDYRHHDHGRLYYSTGEYALVLRELVALFSKRSPRFLICSDGPQDPSQFDEFNFQFGPGHFVEDLYALSKCDYIAGPGSTFSQWASFYGRVPRYVFPYRDGDFGGVESIAPRLEDFRIHTSGFGMYS